MQVCEWVPGPQRELYREIAKALRDGEPVLCGAELRELQAEAKTEPKRRVKAEVKDRRRRDRATAGATQHRDELRERDAERDARTEKRWDRRQDESAKSYQQRSRERAEALARAQERYRQQYETATRFTTVHRGLAGPTRRAAIVKDSTGPRSRTIEVVFFEPEGLGRWHKAAARRAVHGSDYWHQLGTYYRIDGLPGDWSPEPKPVAKARDILAVAPGASPEDIKAAWQRFRTKHHPDKGVDAETFKRGKAAYEALMV